MSKYFNIKDILNQDFDIDLDLHNVRLRYSVIKDNNDSMDAFLKSKGLLEEYKQWAKGK